MAWLRIKIRGRVDPGSIKKSIIVEARELWERRTQALVPVRAPVDHPSAFFMCPLH